MLRSLKLMTFSTS